MNEPFVIFDLDDTLYKEIDFLKSGFRYIVEKLSLSDKEAVYENMLRKYHQGEDVFDYIIRLNPNLGKKTLLEWYHGHTPDIRISDETLACLCFLKKNNISTGLITDGRSLTQRNKIRALGLERFIPDKNIVISEEIGSEKPAINNYTHFIGMNSGHRYFYIGDNPQKDFITPNELGWTTIGLMDNGQNIHAQTSIGGNYNPQFWINDITELIKIINE